MSDPPRLPAPYEVRFTEDAAADISGLDGSIKQQLKKVLTKKLCVDPQGYGTPLRGNLSGYWKHEFASHRIIFRIYDDPQCIVVCAVGSRRGKHATDIYKQFEAVAELGKAAEQIAAVLRGIMKPPK